MAHYKDYVSDRQGTTRTPMGSNLRIVPPGHRTLPVYTRKNVACGAKPSVHTGQAKGQFSANDPIGLDHGNKVSTTTTARSRLSAYECGKYSNVTSLLPQRKSGSHVSKDQPSTRLSEWKPDRMPNKTSAIRPHSIASPQELFQQSIKSVSSNSSHAYSSPTNTQSASWRLGYKKPLDRSLMTDYSRMLNAESFKYTNLNFTREKARALSKLRPQPKSVELTGWRAKLAEEGYTPSTVKKVGSSCRQWHYVDDADQMENEMGFVYVFCKGTQMNGEDISEAHNISRTRTMKIEVKETKNEIVISKCNVEIQVAVEELAAFSASSQTKSKRSFISSRHCSWYHEGSYNKYVSAVPWRNTSYVRPRLMAHESSVPKITTSYKGHESNDTQTEDNKSYRKSVLNMNVPNVDVDAIRKRQEKSRRVGNNDVRKSRTSSESGSSADGSPNETGYDSSFTSFTDYERISDSWTEGIRSISSLSSDNGTVQDVESEYRSNEELCIKDSKVNVNQKTNSMIPSGVRESDFCFHSIKAESSQRDSGFSEILNNSETIPASEIHTPLSDVASKEQGESLQCGNTLNIHNHNLKFIGNCHDIDRILLGESSLELSSAFEDFERHFDRANVDLRSQTCFKRQITPCPKRTPYCKTEGFIGKCHDIDDVLGLVDGMKPLDELEGERTLTHDTDFGDGGSTSATSVFEGEDIANISWLEEFDSPKDHAANYLSRVLSHHIKLDDCTLQLYRYKNGSGEGDYGSYLDLESTIDEQPEEFEGFHNNRKNAVILRTQLSVRVHAIIEKLVNSSGRELRRSLFSLKQIFQDDKDLVHEFVRNDGLACLIKVGSEADQNYQNYILRAMGQVMLYVDGMNGVIEHNETIQWLYSLIASKYRLVVKTALKLLLVFVEYTESNSQLFINAVYIVDSDNRAVPMSNIMNLLKEKDSADMELLVYAATLINKMLNGIPDQDTYYDIVDMMEEQGMEHIIQYYMSKQGTDLDLLQQFHIYEAVLKFEDGVPDTKPLPLDARLRQVPRSRKSYPGEIDRRKSRRHSVGTLSSTTQNGSKTNGSILEKTPEEPSFLWQDRNRSKKEEPKSYLNHVLNSVHMNGNGEHMTIDENGITPALRRRRERDARNKSLIKEQEQNGKSFNPNDLLSVNNDAYESSPLVNEEVPYPSIVERRRSCFESSVETENQKNSTLSKTPHEKSPETDQNPSEVTRPNCLRYARSDTNKKAWMFSMMYAKSQDEDVKPPDPQCVQKAVSPVASVNSNLVSFKKPSEDDSKSSLKRDGSIKDIQEKFNHRYENGSSPTSENRPRLGDSSGLISRAKEGLAASTVRPEPKVVSPTESPNSKWNLESKKLDSDLQWEQLMMAMKRPLVINDLDFTDLNEEEDHDFLPNGESAPREHHESSPPLQIPPPPPPLPLGGGPVAPPPPPPIHPLMNSKIPNSNGSAVPPPWVRRNQHQNLLKDSTATATLKTKKTVKLFWREIKEDRSLLKKIGKKKTIWDELKPVPVDAQKLEHLFENRVKDVMNKEKSQENSKKNEIIVLDTKRSNAINIGMTKLPPPRTIKTAILKMDSTIMNREGIEKILTTMLPTADEKSKIAEAQMSNPDVPLGTAEQFLLTLSSISELEARLRLWAFRLDYDSIEREVAEPLMDLKQAINEIESSETFRVILSTLRSVGNFLNGAEIKGFHIEYLAKVPEVKDTVQKHSLLHHLCHIVIEKFPKSSDLYSEIGSVTRASKVDYAEVSKNLNKMENECKASWDYLKAIAKHDCSITLKVRTSEFLTDCAERIIVLKVVHRRIVNRYHKFLVYLGCAGPSVEDTPIQRVCKILSEFALEYRTTRERVLQQIEKKANHRERNKTRGKMITEMERFRTKEQQADHELRQLLGNGAVNGDDQRIQKWGTVPCHRGRVKSNPGQGGSLGRHSAPAKEEGLTDGDDEILETLVKTATTQPTRNEPRIRKKARYGDRKSLRRTLKNGLSEEERHILSTMAT